jgi:hypothetical protein
VIDFSQFKLYAIQNSEGRLFRPASRTPYNKSQWTDNVIEAHFYGKIGPARAKISEISNTSHGRDIPKLLEVSLGQVTILEETERIQKALKKYLKQQIRYAENTLKWLSDPTRDRSRRPEALLERIEKEKVFIKKLKEELGG